MSLFKESISLNSVAIGFMQDGRYQESAQAMNLALSKLELYFYSPPDRLHTPHTAPIDDQDVPSKESPDDVYTLIAERAGLIRPDSYASSTTPDCGTKRERAFTSVALGGMIIDVDTISEDNVFAFFDRMFHLSHQQASRLGLMKVYALLLFNQAVCQHVNAMVFLSNNPGENPDMHLGKVLWLYERVVEVARTSFRSEDVQEMLCILVAASNNSGHISSTLMLFTETRQCIARVMHLLAVSDESSFTTPDLQVLFWSTCIFLEGRNLQNSPAA